MRDQHEGEPGLAAQVCEQVDHLNTSGEVERRDGLVGEQHARARDQGARDRDALTLTPGELVRVSPHRVGVEADRGEGLGDGCARTVARRDPQGAQRLPDDAVDALAGVEGRVRILEHRLHRATETTHEPTVAAIERSVVEHDAAGVR